MSRHFHSATDCLERIRARTSCTSSQTSDFLHHERTMRFFAISLTTLTFALTACGGGSESATTDSMSNSAGVDLNGAGATFPYPIYSKWVSDYQQATGIKINYQSKGSGAGIKQLQDGIVDFGASDAPMTDEQIAAAKHGAVLHFPTVIGAVVVTYNVASVTTPLRLNGATIAEIFMGQITKWNDARIAA